MSSFDHLNNKSAIEITEEAAEAGDTVETPQNDSEIKGFIQKSPELMPDKLKMDSVKWKHAIRSVLRGRNLMFTGHSGFGKTMAALAVTRALNREPYYFNLGATQDPRTTLIGTRQAKDGSTYFSESLFVKAIQDEDSVILLDEISRAHPEAANILLTPLDPKQRYLRIDEREGGETIKVADGVCFMSTANIGNEYTAARTMDRALLDRFVRVEMDMPSVEEEKELIVEMYPNLGEEMAEKLSKIANQTREEATGDTPELSDLISTRQNLEAASLIHDGFSLKEAAQVAYLPHFDKAGGVSSERTRVKQIVQGYIDDGSDDKLFSDNEIEEARSQDNL